MRRTAVLLIVLGAIGVTSIAQENCIRLRLDLISFCIPEGWTLKDDGTSKGKMAIAAASDDFAPNVGIRVEDINVPLDVLGQYLAEHISEMLKDSATDVRLLERKEFKALNNQQGLKWTFYSKTKGRELRTTQYLFSGQGNAKVFITFTALESQSPALDPIFDRSAKTLQVGN